MTTRRMQRDMEAIFDEAVKQAAESKAKFQSWRAAWPENDVRRQVAENTGFRPRRPFDLAKFAERNYREQICQVTARGGMKSAILAAEMYALLEYHDSVESFAPIDMNGVLTLPRSGDVTITYSATSLTAGAGPVRRA